jgi:nitrate reductase NapD
MVAVQDRRARMNIAGVLVHANAQRMPQVRGVIEQLAGVEIHAISEAGHLVVTLESENDEQILLTLESLRTIPSVYSTSLVYHHCEPDEDQPCAKKECKP